MSGKKKQDFITPIVITASILLAIFLVRHFHIKNFNAVIPGELYTSGQPRGMDYTRLLYKYHLGTIVNVRQSSERREENWYNEEKIAIKDLGVNYTEIPIAKRGEGSGFPNKDAQKQFLEIMSDKNNLPVLIHGNAGTKRASRLTAVWLIRGKGYSVEDTLSVMKKIKGEKPTKEEIEFVNNMVD